MIRRIHDPEYDRLVERFFALCTLIVFLTIGICVWKIGSTVLSL